MFTPDSLLNDSQHPIGDLDAIKGQLRGIDPLHIKEPRCEKSACMIARIFWDCVYTINNLFYESFYSEELEDLKGRFAQLSDSDKNVEKVVHEVLIPEKEIVTAQEAIEGVFPISENFTSTVSLEEQREAHEEAKALLHK